MAPFKQPNLIDSEDFATALAADNLLGSYFSGRIMHRGDYKVLWMSSSLTGTLGEGCALIKTPSFSYNGRSYSGSVYLVDTLTAGRGGWDRGLERTVHVCGKSGFCVGRDYAGGYGRLTAEILADLIAAAPAQFAAWHEERKVDRQERKERKEREQAEREQAEARAEKWDALAAQHKECFDRLMAAVVEAREETLKGSQTALSLVSHRAFNLADVVQAQEDFGPRALPTEES